MSVAFTPEQLHAVETRDGSLFLHANAGSGKTSVAVERFVRAVVDDEVPVERILAITFTEEGRRRAEAEDSPPLPGRGLREHARTAEAAWISPSSGASPSRARIRRCSSTKSMKPRRSRPSSASYSRARRISLRTFAIRRSPPACASTARS